MSGPPAATREAMPDFPSIVRLMKTSHLLLMLFEHGQAEARAKIVDPDGDLERRYFGSASAPDIRDAKAELDRREQALAEALCDEIDRRIPVAE